MTIGIYCIENLVNGKKYIGKAVDIHKRFTTHRSALKAKTFSKATNRLLWLSVQKYGFENFHFGVIETHVFVDEVRLSERELYWQDFYNVYDRCFGYNLLRQSAGVTKHSQETKDLIGAASSKFHLGKKKSEAHCAAYRASFTPERRAYLSKVNKGKTRTPEQCKRISDSLIGKTFSDERKAVLSKAQTGLKRSPSHILNAADGVRMYSYEQYTPDGLTLIKTFARMSEIVALGFIQSSITNVCRGTTRYFVHKGFHWKKIPKQTLDETL